MISNRGLGLGLRPIFVFGVGVSVRVWWFLVLVVKYEIGGVGMYGLSWYEIAIPTQNLNWCFQTKKKKKKLICVLQSSISTY